MSSITDRLDAIIAASTSDSRLAKIVEDVVDYAQIYSLARKRQDGCAGKGELFALRAEFQELIEMMSEHSVKRGYILNPFNEDIDRIADDILLKSKL
jgi:hypothetical protein